MRFSRSEVFAAGLAAVVFLVLAVESRAAERIRPEALPGQRRLELAKRHHQTLAKPVEIKDQQVELHLKTGDFASQDGPSVGTPGMLRLLCYNGQPVGPTIRVRRGTHLKLRLSNELAKLAGAPASGLTKPPANDFAEAPHMLSRTNLHTHGLHVSPADPADNVFLCVDPGQSVDFDFEIPPDHPAGTFWYHPHRHGSAAYQISNGLAGALIVEGEPDDKINDLEDIREIAAAEDIRLVFQLYNLRVRCDANQVPLPGKVAWIDADTIYNVRGDARRSDAIQMDPDDDSGETTAFQATAINGQINPTLVLRPGEIQRWRLIHAAWDLDRQLTIVDDNDNPSGDLTLDEIALDGLATGVMSRKSMIELAPGQRSDVLIRAPLLPPDVPERVYHLKQNAVDGSTAPHSSPQDSLFLAKIVVIGKPCDMRLPDPKAVAKCRPFPDVADDEVIARPPFEFAAFDGDDTTAPHYTINGVSFMQQRVLELPVDSAEEWTLKATESNHPFHIHVNPFQVVGYVDAGGRSTPMNVWRDTLYVKANESYIIRMRFQHFDGKSVFHCHILDHEDQGMMMPIQLTKRGAQPPKQKLCPDALPQKLLSTNRPAPALKLPDTQNVVHSLDEYKQGCLIVVFFRGVECFHCATQLRDLVRETAAVRDLDCRIIAVSSQSIDDGIAARKALGAEQWDRLNLLVDSQHEAFRDFGCFDTEPQHGIFVLDGNGQIRASYVGEAPFNDSKAILRRVRDLEQQSAP